MPGLLIEALVFLGLATALIVDGAINLDHRLQDAITLVVVVLIVELRWRARAHRVHSKINVVAPDSTEFRSHASRLRRSLGFNKES